MYKILLIAFIFFTQGFIQAQNLPSSYDLRDVNGHNYVSSVKAQQGGTCWTHGAMAAIEGNLILTGVWQQSGETGEPNMAEYHLDWWNGFNQFNNDDLSPPTGNGLSVHNGGDYRVTAAYLSRGEGAVRDIDAQIFVSAPILTDTSYHYFYCRDIEWYADGENSNRINIIKQKIIQYGVMGTCMCVGGFWTNGNIHYQPISDLNEPNHAIAIVGWDDNFQTPAEQPGAWLCKNSWGSGWGNNGYFWISYFDKHCGKQPQMGAVSLYNIEPNKYDHFYYHDYHGWRDEMPKCYEAINQFKSQKYEKLRSVSFYTAKDSISYRIIVARNFNFNHLTDTLNVKSGFINHLGFHTIDLDSITILSPSETFFIYLFLSDGGMPFDRTSEVPVLLGSTSRTSVTSTSKLSQSYFLDDLGIWKDLYTFDTSANFCIKGLSNYLLPDTCKKPQGDTSVCLGQGFSIYKIPKTNFTENYLWQLSPQNAGYIVNFDTIAHIYWNNSFSGSASLNVKGLNSSGNGAFSNSLLIKKHQLPEVYIGNDTSITSSQSITLTTTNNYTSYLWNTLNTSSSIIVSGNQFNPGIYSFSVLVTDSNNCMNSDTILITIIDDVNINENNSNAFSITPNPAHTDCIINLYSTVNQDISVNIYDMYRIIIKENFKVFAGQNTKKINISTLKDGIYIVVIKEKTKQYYKKLIISN